MSDKGVPTIPRLKEALDAAGIEYEEKDGGITVSDEAREYLINEGLLGVEGKPVHLTKEDLEGEVKSYTYEKVELDTIEPEQYGDVSPFTDLTDEFIRSRITTHDEIYIGGVEECMGEKVVVKRYRPTPDIVYVKFKDASHIINGKAVGVGWHPFPPDHVTDFRTPLDQWRDVPSAARAVVRKKYNAPRLFDDTRFQYKKEMRRGTPGAFGGKTARRKRKLHMQENRLRRYLVSVICENPEDSKSIGVSSPTRQTAIKDTRAKFERDFPDATITNILIE